MIVRLRLKAGVYISGILLFLGVALMAQANQPVTQSQMESFVYARIAAAGLVVFTAFWILLNTISGRSEKAQMAASERSERALVASVERLEDAVAAFARALADHDGSPLAHRAASEHNHIPMQKQMDAIEQKLDRLIREHEIINSGCAFGIQRSPKDSPHPKRKTDSGADYTPLRGRDDEG